MGRSTWGDEVMRVIGAELAASPDVIVAVDDGGLVFTAAPGDGGRRVPVALPFAPGAIATLAVSFVGDASTPHARRALLDQACRAVRPGGTLVVIDHNRPRRRLAALVALARSPRLRGSPSARWRRQGHPVAREARDCGLTVERLRLAVGERVQIVIARVSSAAT